MPPFGFWCSWIAPSACPNSWTTTRSYSVASVSSFSHPKFIVGLPFAMPRQSVPMYDHDPSSATNETRTCASALLALKSSVMLANLLHFTACSCTRAFCVAEPSRKKTPSVLPSAHFLPASSAIFSGAPIDDAPKRRRLALCGGGRFVLFSLNAACIAAIFSAPVRMRSTHIWIFGLRLLLAARFAGFFMVRSPRQTGRRTRGRGAVRHRHSHCAHGRP